MGKHIMGKISAFVENKTVSNGIWLYVLQAFNTIFPLITVPYITRVLGAEKYGVFSGAVNMFTYLQSFVEFGFSLSATRQVSIEERNGELNRLFSLVLWARIMLYGFAWAFVGSYILVVDDTNEAKQALLVLCIGLMAYCIQQNWLFLGKQDMKVVSITNVISRVIATTLIFTFVRSSEDLLVYCVLYSASPFLSNLLGLLVAKKKYNLTIIGVPLKDVIQFLKKNIYIFFTQFGSVVFSSVGVTCLKIFTSDYDVGVYSAIYKIPYVVLLAWGPISQVIFPISCARFSQGSRAGLKFVRNMKVLFLAIFIFLVFLVSIAAKPILNIVVGQEYVEYVFIVYPLLAWVVLGILNNFYGVQTLVAAGRDREYGKCFRYGLFFTVLFSAVFTYIWGIYGAAVAPVFAEGILYMIFRYKVKQIIR